MFCLFLHTLLLESALLGFLGEHIAKATLSEDQSGQVAMGEIELSRCPGKGFAYTILATVFKIAQGSMLSRVLEAQGDSGRELLRNKQVLAGGGVHQAQ